MGISDKKKRYLELPPTSNEMWLAQTIINEFSDEEIDNLRQVLTKLDSAMFKSWAKEMTFQQVLYSVKIIDSLG